MATSARKARNERAAQAWARQFGGKKHKKSGGMNANKGNSDKKDDSGSIKT